MTCTRDRWLNVFVTKPDVHQGETYEFDDKFMCSVQSVALGQGPNPFACIVDRATEYLMPTWSIPYAEGGDQSSGGFGNHPFRNIKAGDIVRVGNPSTFGHTDYLTVIEVRHVQRVYNMLGSEYAIHTDGTGGKLPLSPYSIYDSDATSQLAKQNKLRYPAENAYLEPDGGNKGTDHATDAGGPTSHGLLGNNHKGTWLQPNTLSTDALNNDHHVIGGNFTYHYNASNTPPTGSFKTPGGSGNSETIGSFFNVGTAGIAHIVLRVNALVNATGIPNVFWGNVNQGTSTTSTYTRYAGVTSQYFSGTLSTETVPHELGGAGGGVVPYANRGLAMQNRHLLTSSLSAPKGNVGVKLITFSNSGEFTAFRHADPVPAAEVAHFQGTTSGTVQMEDEKYLYPLYLNNKWSHSSTLYANLDHGVKSLSCIKLVGYSVTGKRQVGVSHQHELINDDYFVLHVKEIEGKVVSNNKHVNGAFAVLHVPVGNQNEGAIEHSLFDPQGIVTHHFDNCDSTIRNLTITMTDRLGQPAHIGRLHLWFKLLVIHG